MKDWFEIVWIILLCEIKETTALQKF